MDENKISIDDLSEFAKPRLAKLQEANGVHFSTEDPQELAKQVAQGSSHRATRCGSFISSSTPQRLTGLEMKQGKDISHFHVALEFLAFIGRQSPFLILPRQFVHAGRFPFGDRWLAGTSFHYPGDDSAKVSNINGTGENSCRCGSWLQHWINFSRRAFPRYCSESHCLNSPDVGAHVQVDGTASWFIIPLCRDHNVPANVAQTCGR